MKNTKKHHILYLLTVLTFYVVFLHRTLPWSWPQNVAGTCRRLRWL